MIYKKWKQQDRDTYYRQRTLEKSILQNTGPLTVIQMDVVLRVQSIRNSTCYLITVSSFICLWVSISLMDPHFADAETTSQSRLCVELYLEEHCDLSVPAAEIRRDTSAPPKFAVTPNSGVLPLRADDPAGASGTHTINQSVPSVCHAVLELRRKGTGTRSAMDMLDRAFM